MKCSILSLFVVQSEMSSSSAVKRVGRGYGDACVGTWDLGTRDEGLEDIKYGTRGLQTQGRRGGGDDNDY